MVPQDFEWMARAACKDKDTAIWFASNATRAREICASCPVAADCLEYAIADPLPVVGIFGGTDERERAAIRRERRAPRTMTA